jgi:hypothetical protein
VSQKKTIFPLGSAIPRLALVRLRRYTMPHSPRVRSWMFLRSSLIRPLVLSLALTCCRVATGAFQLRDRMHWEGIRRPPEQNTKPSSKRVQSNIVIRRTTKKSIQIERWTVCQLFLTAANKQPKDLDTSSIANRSQALSTNIGL